MACLKIEAVQYKKQNAITSESLKQETRRRRKLNTINKKIGHKHMGQDRDFSRKWASRAVKAKRSKHAGGTRLEGDVRTSGGGAHRIGHIGPIGAEYATYDTDYGRRWIPTRGLGKGQVYLGGTNRRALSGGS